MVVCRERKTSARDRGGQALLEFAIIAFVLTFLLAAILTFGFMLFGANVLQQAADVGAQEFARTPLPPICEFPDLVEGRSSTDPTAAVPSGAANVFADDGFRAQIFDERFLVCEFGGPNAPGEDLPANPSRSAFENLQQRMPLINRLLFPLMIVEDIAVDGNDLRVLRLPGAVVRNTSSHPDTGGPELTVLIPIVRSRQESLGGATEQTGVETGIAWYAVLEEIRGADGGLLNVVGPTPASGIGRGFVAMRLNYPSQSGALVAYQYEATSGFTGSGLGAIDEGVEVNMPISAVDPEGFDPPDPYELVVSPGRTGPHAGSFGLGSLGAYTKAVRPYRRVLSAQGIYRREVFQ